VQDHRGHKVVLVIHLKVQSDPQVQQDLVVTKVLSHLKVIKVSKVQKVQKVTKVPKVVHPSVTLVLRVHKVRKVVLVIHLKVP
jgi:hypothetical protein